MLLRRQLGGFQYNMFVNKPLVLKANNFLLGNDVLSLNIIFQVKYQENIKTSWEKVFILSCIDNSGYSILKYIHFFVFCSETLWEISYLENQTAFD